MEFIHQNYNNKVSVYRYSTLLFEPHLHRAVEIIVMLKGSCTANIDGKEVVIKKGDVLTVFPNCIHSYTKEEKVFALGLIVDMELFPELVNDFRHKRISNPVIKAEKLANSGIEALAAEMAEKYYDASKAVRKGYILLLIGKLKEFYETEESQDISEELVEEIFNFCRENYSFGIRLGDVAEKLHISSGYLSHIFSKRIGMSFCDYINSLKTVAAAELISKTDKSMTEIAELSGFSTIRTFNRAFKKHIGVPPSDFKKGIKKKTP